MLSHHRLLCRLESRRLSCSSSRSARLEAFGFALEYWSEIKAVKTENLVFLDEMGVLLGLMPTRARSLEGRRAYDFKPFYRGKKITVIGAMTHDCCSEIKTLDKGMNGEDFQQFLKEELASKLWSGAVQSLSAQVRR